MLLGENMELIGIDLGTTSICGVVIDTDSGKIIRSRTVESQAFIETQNSWEKIQSHDKIISIAKGILDSFITDKTACIGVTGQMHGIVYTDRSGNAVSPLYTWQDGRGNLPFGDTTYAEHLGSHSGYGFVTDFYNRENNLVPETAVSFCTIHDYFVMRLCGLKKPLVHITDAASFGLYDIEKGVFECDVPFDITNDYTICGEYNGIPVAVAIGDNQASVFTNANLDAILLNYGTGSQVSVISENTVCCEGIEVRPFFEGNYLLVGAALCGGRAFAVLKDFYKSLLRYVTDVSDAQVYALMDKMLSVTQKSEMEVDTRFSGTREDEDIRGAVRNISTENFTAENLTYALVEGMVNELFDMYVKMGVCRKTLVGSGNALRKNPTLVKTAEEKFGSKMKISPFTEDAAVGAALFAAIASKIYKNHTDAQLLLNV